MCVLVTATKLCKVCVRKEAKLSTFCGVHVMVCIFDVGVVAYMWGTRGVTLSPPLRYQGDAKSRWQITLENLGSLRSAANPLKIPYIEMFVNRNIIVMTFFLVRD